MTRNGAVFAVCLLLATLLLFLNKLSRSYISDVKAKVRYVQLPQEKIPTTPLPGELKLYVETTGFKLIWYKLMKPSLIQINLSTLKADYLPTSELTSVVASQLSSDYKLIEITPDTLHFNFAKGITKKVPVLPDILISFKKQFDFMEPLLISPDTSIVSGPENILDTITSWKTERLIFQNLDKSKQGELALVPPPNSTIIVQPQKIRYTIPVEEYTEKTVEVDIENRNVPSKKEIKTYPNKATVIFRVGLSNYDHVSAESFKAVADFSGVDFNRSKYIPVNIESAPSFIKNLDYSPKSVEYIIYH